MTKISVYYLRKLAEWYWHVRRKKTKGAKTRTRKKRFLKNLLSIFLIMENCTSELKTSKWADYLKCSCKIYQMSWQTPLFKSTEKSTFKENL
jgi:hypothetical protein